MCFFHGLMVAMAAVGMAGDREAVAMPSIAAPGVEYKLRAGPHEVVTLRQDWTDDKRQREVPVKLYLPLDADEPCPVVLFSHSLGGSREGYAYLGRHWASHGYVSVHMQHPGTDESLWRGRDDASSAMGRAAKNPDNVVDRAEDISFAIDELTRCNEGQDDSLHERLDLNRIAMAGHAYGAMTTLIVVGEVGNTFSKRENLADPRVRAFVVMSPPVPVHRGGFDKMYAPIRIPGLHLTGTFDEVETGRTKASDRRIPFDHIEGADQYLVTLRGGTTRVFTGRERRGRGGERDERLQDVVRMVTTAFLDGHLRGDKKAMQWLDGENGFVASAGKDAAIEIKKQAAPSAGP